MLPGEHQDMLNSTGQVVGQFPVYSATSLCQADLILLFQLVSLNTSTLLQEPASVHAARLDKPRRHTHHPIISPHKTRGTAPFNVTKDAAAGDVYDPIEESVEDLEELKSVEREPRQDVQTTGTSWATSTSFIPSFDLLRSMGCLGLLSTNGNPHPLSNLANSSSDSSSRSESRSDSQMNVQGLLEAVRKGRVFLLNALQVCCFGPLML